MRWLRHICRPIKLFRACRNVCQEKLKYFFAAFSPCPKAVYRAYSSLRCPSFQTSSRRVPPRLYRAFSYYAPPCTSSLRKAAHIYFSRLNIFFYLVAVIFYKPGLVAPVLFDLDVGGEKDFGAQKLFHILAGKGRHLLYGGALLAY